MISILLRCALSEILRVIFILPIIHHTNSFLFPVYIFPKTNNLSHDHFTMPISTPLDYPSTIYVRPTDLRQQKNQPSNTFFSLFTIRNFSFLCVLGVGDVGGLFISGSISYCLRRYFVFTSQRYEQRPLILPCSHTLTPVYPAGFH